MKSIFLADVSSLNFEADKSNKRIDYAALLNDLKGAYNVVHATAYAQSLNENFERLLVNNGYEVILDKTTHNYQLCMDALDQCIDFDHVILASTRYYLAPLIRRLNRRGVPVLLNGINVPAYIQAMGPYAEIVNIEEDQPHEGGVPF